MALSQTMEASSGFLSNNGSFEWLHRLGQHKPQAVLSSQIAWKKLCCRNPKDSRCRYYGREKMTEGFLVQVLIEPVSRAT